MAPPQQEVGEKSGQLRHGRKRGPANRLPLCDPPRSRLESLAATDVTEGAVGPGPELFERLDRWSAGITDCNSSEQIHELASLLKGRGPAIMAWLRTLSEPRRGGFGAVVIPYPACFNRLLKFYSCGAIRRWKWAQNAHLLLVNCAFSPISALSRTRLSKFQQPVNSSLITFRNASSNDLSCALMCSRNASFISVW